MEGSVVSSPYRGAMPEPERLAIRIEGHLVQAESPDELLAKLRRLGEALDFQVSDDMVITFGHGRGVTVKPEEPSWPN